MRFDPDGPIGRAVMHAYFLVMALACVYAIYVVVEIWQITHSR
jgi:hypothetical protein